MKNEYILKHKAQIGWVTAGFATCRVRYVRVRYMFSTA